MGPRNLLILFFSTVAVSLVILIIFFSLFFKNVDLNFNTRLPQSAPVIGGLGEDGAPMDPNSKAEGLMRSTVNVPPEFRDPNAPAATEKPADAQPSDSDLPPISDDVMLDEHAPPVPGRVEPLENGTDKRVNKTPTAPTPSPRAAEKRPAERPMEPVSPPAQDMQPLVPPVPEQGAVSPTYRVVMGRYSTRDEADAAAARAAGMGVVPVVKQSGGRYAVQLGNFANRRNAEALADKTGASVEATN